jgi:hypothetical protein
MDRNTCALQAALVEEEQVCQPCAEDMDQSDGDAPASDPIEQLSDKHSDMVIEVLLRMLDWMGVHKNTWASSTGVWEMLQTQVPDPENFPVFSAVKAVLIEYMNGRVELVPICVNNCMAFYNSKSEGYQDAYWQTADDDFCKHCGEDRWCRPNIHAPTGMNRKVNLCMRVLQRMFNRMIHLGNVLPSHGTLRP